MALSQEVLDQLQQQRSFLFNKGICDTDVERIAEIMKTNSVILELNLGSNQIGDSGALALFYALIMNSTVCVLHLHRNKIGDGGAVILAEAMKTNTCLRELYLGDNIIGDIGAEALAQAIETNNTLHKLNLRGNKVGDSGAQAIAKSLQANTTLFMLDLDGNPIGEPGTTALVQARMSNQSIQKLVFGWTKATSDVTANAGSDGAAHEREHSEYSIYLDNVAHLPLGLGVHNSDNALRITSIRSGLIEDWNAQNSSDTVVQIGDCIMEVNGIRGPPSELFKECKKREVSRMTLRRVRSTVSVSQVFTSGQKVYISGMKDRVEWHGRIGTTIEWYNSVKRWKVRFDDNSVVMCQIGDLTIHKEITLPGGYHVGDRILSMIEHACDNEAILQVGDEGTIEGPCGDPQEMDADLKVCVIFGVGRVNILATNIMPKEAELYSDTDYTIQLEKTTDAKLGLDVDHADGNSLRILSISAGLIEDWNRHSCPQTVVGVGDCIVEVNGCRADVKQMVTECRRSQRLSLTLRRNKDKRLVALPLQWI